MTVPMTHEQYRNAMDGDVFPETNRQAALAFIRAAVPLLRELSSIAEHETGYGWPEADALIATYPEDFA